MKINFPNLFQTLLNKYKIFFIFGNDPVVSERAIQYIQKMTPLSVRIQSEGEILKPASHQPSLFEEKTSSFLTLVPNVTDKILGSLDQLGEGLFIFTSEKARAGSKLVTHFSGDSQTLAIAAYEAPLIQGEFKTLVEGMNLTSAFQESLFKIYQNDFYGLLAALEKIKLFGEINPEHYDLFLDGSSLSEDMGPLLKAFLLKDPRKALNTFHAISSSESISLLRALSRAFMTLFELTHYKRSKTAINWQKLSPPVFFKEQPLFEAALLKWKLDDVRIFLQTLLFLEEKVKYSSYGSSQVGQALLERL
jgi:DNA polymerase III delta subunit